MSEDPHQDGPIHSCAKNSLALNYSSSNVNMKLQEENTKLRDENAELRQQIRLTTQQLEEAMAALARAMGYIQRMSSSHASKSLQTKSQTLRAKQPPSKSIQTDSTITSPTSHVQSESPILNKRTEALQGGQPIAFDAATANVISSRHEIKNPPPLNSRAKISIRDGALLQPRSSLYFKTSLQERYENWLKNSLVVSTDNDILQRDLWEVYKETFPKTAPECPLSIPSHLMKLAMEVFPQAQCLSVGVGTETKFIVRGLAWNVN